MIFFVVKAFDRNNILKLIRNDFSFFGIQKKRCLLSRCMSRTTLGVFHSHAAALLKDEDKRSLVLAVLFILLFSMIPILSNITRNLIRVLVSIDNSL